MNIELRGLRDVLNSLAPQELLGKPLRNFYHRAAIYVQGKARPKTPVDNGLLRNRLLTEIDSSPLPQWSKVGFLNATEGTELYSQARAMEYGTGRRGDPAVSHKAGHFPPSAKLDVWAARHGFPSGFVVARIIARRGGLDPRHMLKDGLRESLSAIQGFVKKLASEIKAQWEN